MKNHFIMNSILFLYPGIYESIYMTMEILALCNRLKKCMVMALCPRILMVEINKAGVSWSLWPTLNPLVFQVSNECPYFNLY